MADARLGIEELAAKSGDDDFLRAIAESVMQLITEADVDGQIAASPILAISASVAPFCGVSTP